MDFLNYTKKLFKKINFYDKNIKNTNYKSSNPNPFNVKEPMSLTIIWVENNDKKL